MSPRLLRHLAVPAGPTGVHRVFESLPSALDGSGPALALLPEEEGPLGYRIRQAVRPEDPTAPLESDDIAVVITTSGSTGDPKGVLLTAAALEASAKAATQVLPGPGQWLVTLPVTSAGGLQTIIRSLQANTDPVILPSVAGAERFTAAGFLAGCEKLVGGKRQYVSLVPTQLARILADADATDALRDFDQILLGGAAASPQLLAAAAAERLPVTVTYGMTETGGGCIYNGIALPGAKVRIDTASNNQIVLSGPMLASGYRLRPEETAAVFRDGEFYTSDRGVITDGALQVLGRSDQVVQVDGTNVDIVAVQQALNRLLLGDVTGSLHRSGVDAAVIQGAQAIVVAPPAAGDRGSVICAFLAEASDNPTDATPEQRLDTEDIDLSDVTPWPTAAARVMTFGLLDELGRAATPRHYWRLDQLPMLPTGKVDTALLAELAQRLLALEQE